MTAINDGSEGAARRTPTQEEIAAQYDDPNRPPPCAECSRRPVPSRLVAGSWIDNHSGTCPQNGALQVCERCGHRHVDRDFGQALACIMDVPLAEGREMQRRIVDRVANGLGIAPEEPDGNGSEREGGSA